MSEPQEGEQFKTPESGIIITVDEKIAGEDWVNKLIANQRHVDRRGIKNPAHASANVSLTKNMGDYQSLRVGCMISLPCDPTIEGVLSTSDICIDLANEKALQMLEKWEGAQF